MSNFPYGTKVRVNAAGLEKFYSHPMWKDRVGTVDSKRYNSVVRIVWEGNRSPTEMAEKWLEIATSKPEKERIIDRAHKANVEWTENNSKQTLGTIYHSRTEELRQQFKAMFKERPVSVWLHTIAILMEEEAEANPVKVTRAQIRREATRIHEVAYNTHYVRK